MNYNKCVLIIGAFLTLVTISSFAQQPNKVELLTHLKQAREHSLSRLDFNTKCIEKILKGDIDCTQVGFDRMIHLWSDLFYALDPHEKQFDADATICLDLLCQTQDNIMDIFDDAPENGIGQILITIGDVITSKNKNLNNKDIKNNYEAVISVFIKHIAIDPDWAHYKHSNDYLNDPVLAEKIESYLICCGDYWCMCCGDFWGIGSITMYETKVLEKLLPKLNAKIKELEAQV